MSEDLIRYDVLTQDALRNVIRKVLEEVVVAGLPGDHHFFITFDTTHPGVRLSDRMRERYPESMTIVIQHSYWDLQTSETGFELDLTFNEIRERLRVPYISIQAFFDPSVKFGLQFDPEPGNDQISEEETENAAPQVPTKLVQPAEKTQGKAASKDDQPDEAPAAKSSEDENSSEDKPAEVVSLDAFRKKK